MKKLFFGIMIQKQYKKMNQFKIIQLKLLNMNKNKYLINKIVQKFKN